MRSVIRKQSSGSVTIFWLDREGLVANLGDAATELGASRPEVQEVILFGSAAAGTAVPGSDADVLIVVSDSPVRPIDRPAPYQPFFQSIGVGVDLFVVTREEMGRAQAAIHARKDGKTLYVKAPLD
jgi:predicted nucleotidyltransferase